MIDLFVGEFLITPIPLELSFNYCSHKCAYCFANLNVPDRRVNIKAVQSMVVEFQQRNTLQARLMQQGYPICISNKVDPLAVTNDNQAIPIVAMLQDLGVPVQIQTKGGRKENQLIAAVSQKSVWYVSISFMDDALRKKIEPGAPAIQQRLDLIQQLSEAGHTVILGLNPLVPEWLPEPEGLFEECHKRGCRYAWIESLHLHTDQIRNMSDREQNAVGSDIIARSKQAKWSDAEKNHLDRSHEIGKRLGWETFTIGYWHRSKFHDAFRQCYRQTFPTMQDFVNECWGQLGDESGVISYDAFEATLMPRLPDISGNLCHYLRAGNYGVVEKYKDIPNNLKFRGVLRRGWLWPELTWAPSRMRCFAMAIEQLESQWSVLTDETGMPFHVWCPHGTEDRFMDAGDLLSV